MRNICVSSNHSDLTVDPKHPLSKNHPHHRPVRIPYQRGFKTKKPASPLTSPTTSSSSSGKITKNKGREKKKNYYTREQRIVEREIDRAFDDIERAWDRRMEEFSQQQNKPHEYDDEALGNINEEPYGFYILMEISDHRRNVSISFSMLTIFGQTFSSMNPQRHTDIIMTSLPLMTSLLHHYDLIPYL